MRTKTKNLNVEYKNVVSLIEYKLVFSRLRFMTHTGSNKIGKGNA
jgi:hypothetical protein